ncbi:MAG: serine/threonine protein kinase [Actinobacteria bacterium]|nr:serine/threonine protein kinase [Actinomycetota bacterium]
MEKLIAERYELKDAVGKGGMSTVYLAYDTQLERNVALKILHEHFSEDDDYVARFRHEARAAAQLSHPGIVTVIDRGEEDGRQFIVFEFVQGETLKDLVERGGPMPVRRVLEVALEVGRALSFAHQQGLIHRDVKPQNVLVNGEGRAKVTDFGIARSLDAVGQTETGTVLGTSHYIAPEQARGERVDAQTDVYSFGVVLHELLAGFVPYSGDNFLTVALRHVNEPVPSVLEARPDAPLRLATLVERCMAKAPEERPGSMGDVVAELEACLAELDGRQDGDATMIVRRPVVKQIRPRRERSVGRSRIPRVLMLLGAIVLAAIVGFAVLGRGEDGVGEGSAPGAPPVELVGVGSYDPEGDGAEHPESVAEATDDDPVSYWTTETYQDFSSTKDGVGLVLEGDDGRRLSSLTVVTDTPGFTAEIRAGASPGGPFEVVAEGKPVAARTSWELDGTDARYYVVWITELEGRARVNEVTAN